MDRGAKREMACYLRATTKNNFIVNIMWWGGSMKMEGVVEVDCRENKGVWGFSVHGIEWHSIIKTFNPYDVIGRYWRSDAGHRVVKVR
jgi:hypothetical protein